MGLDAPGIAPTRKPLKRSKRTVVADIDRRVREASRSKPVESPDSVDRRSAAARRAEPTMDDRRAQSSANTREWARRNNIQPRSRAELARTPISSRRRAPAGDVNTGPLRATRPGVGTKITPRAQRASPEKSIASIGRVFGHTTRAIASTTAEDFGGSARKTVSTAGDLAKGLAVLAAGVPYTLAYPVNRALGNEQESPGRIARRMLKQEKKRISTTYGPSWRGDKNSGAHVREIVKREGPLLPALDMAVVAGPTSSALGLAAKSGKLGKGAKAAVTTRPNVRYGIEGATKDGRVRPTAIGAVVAKGHDAARRGGQKVAVARSNKRLRVRAAERVLRRPPSTGSLAHADPKPLSPRRALLKPGEVTPLVSGRATRSLRFNVSRHYTAGETAARLRVNRFVTGKDGVQQIARSVPKELSDLPKIAQQLGIRDAAGARKIIALRLAEIEKRTAEALAGKGPHGKRDADTAAALKGEAVEAARLRELQAKPELFERADVQAATARLTEVERTAVTGREGIGPERLAAGRSQLVGETLGVQTAKQLNDRAKATHLEGRASSKLRYEDAVAKRDKVRTTSARVLASARADLAKAQGRAEVLSRNVSGTNTLRGAGTSKYSGGALGVRRAQEALDSAKARVEAELGEATTAVKAAADARKAAYRAPVKKIAESPRQYELRVAEEAESLGLAAPEFATSKFTGAEEGVRKLHPRADTTPTNPLGKKRQGTNYRLGNQAHEVETSTRDLRATIERGARIEAEQNLLREHGMYFPGGKAEADAWVAARGLDPADMVAFPATGGVVRKDMAGALDLRTGKDHGDYVAAKGLFLTEKVVKDELDALSVHASNPGKILRRLAHLPQAALLALSPSWWAFQRVNDLVGMVAGGSARQTRSYGQMLRALDPDSREITKTMSGGSMAAELLTPHTGQKLGRMQRVLDENPTYKAALNSDAPATNLLIKLTADGPTVLLRSDAKITGNVRERQFIHNLQQLAAKMDPDVKQVVRGFGPMGHALKTGDTALMAKLLKDPKYAKVRDEAAASLSRVMGDWHVYTAAEKRVKGAFAFYGFLRYSTRMAFYTLPVDHPYVGLLVAQIGAMGDADARAIIGDDLPYGLGKLYQSNGEVAGDLVRANPITGPLTSITKPEHIFQLGTPLISIMVSSTLGQATGLSDSSEGYVKQLTVKGDPKDNRLGGFLSEERLRVLGDQTLSLLSPYKSWKGFDSRQQSSDSLAWDRRIMQGSTGAEQEKIDAKNKLAGDGGWRSVARSVAPLAVPGDGKNWKDIGAKATTDTAKRASDEKLRRAKRRGALGTPLGRAKIKLEGVDARVEAKTAGIDEKVAAIDRAIQLKLAEKGLAP